MPWKLNADGTVASVNGQPLFVHSDGKEAPFDADRAMSKIAELNSESASRRLKLDDAEKRLESFKGLEPDKVRAALDTVANLEAKKLIDAGKVDELVKERLSAASGEWEKERRKLDEALRAKERQLYGAVVSKAISTSPVLKDIVLPADAVERLYSDHIRLSEDGRSIVVHADPDGKQPIYSKERPGEFASLDEGLRSLLERRPDFDAIKRVVKVDGVPGPGGTQRGAGGKQMKRADFLALPPSDQVKVVKEGVVPVD